MGMKWLLLCCVLVCSGVLSSGKITHRKVEKASRRWIQVEMPFGFAPGGGVSLTVSNIVVEQAYKEGNQEKTLKELGVDRMGFYITTIPGLDRAAIDMEENQCDTDKEKYVKPILQFNETLVKSAMKGSFSQDVRIPDPGMYMLFFAQCGHHDMMVSFHVRVEMYNVYKTSNGKEVKDYLSVGERELPAMYLSMFLAFCALGVGWVYMCIKERANIHTIHYLMFVLIVLRALTLFTQAGMYHYDQISGNPDGWNIAFYIFTFVRGIMFFTVVVLIGTGWSYLRPFIGDQEKKVLIVVIPLQVFANIAIIVLDETSPIRRAWFTWQDMFHLVDIICCCAILFPIVWSIKHLREGAETDGKAAANIEKLTLFRQFYIMVVVYIYFTRIIVYMLQNLLPYNLKWIGFLASQLATLVFYIMTGKKFCPHSENKYLKLENEVA